MELFDANEYKSVNDYTESKIASMECGQIEYGVLLQFLKFA